MHAATTPSATIGLRRRRRPRSSRLPVNLAGSLLLALLLFLTVYPVLMLLIGSFREGMPGAAGAFTLDGYRNAYADRLTYQTWANSVVLAVCVTSLSTSIAALFAFVVARTDTPLRGLVFPIMTLTYLMPSIFLAFAWSMLGTPRAGLVNVLWTSLVPGASPLINVYSWPGLVFIQALVTVPLKFLLLLGAFYGMDRSLEEASRVSGAGKLRTVLSVDLPVLAPTLFGVLILGFIRGLQSLEVPLFIGFPAKIYVFATRIYDYLQNNFPAKYQEATALCVSLLVVLLALVLLQWRLLGQREFVTVTGKGYRPEVWKIGRVKYLFTACIVVYALAALVLPAVQLVMGSLTKVFGLYSVSLFTLDNYRTALNEPLVQRAVANTLLLAASGGFLAMALTTAIAYVVARTKFRLRRGLDLAVWVPWTLPGIVLGTALLWAYVSVPGLKALYGTNWLLLLGLVVTVIPVGTRVMAGALVQLGNELEESSRVLGATWRYTFFRIVLPLVGRSFGYGWLLTAIIISGELSVPLLLYAPGSETLSVAILALQIDGKPSVAAAVFSMLLLAAAVVLLVGRLGSLAVARLAARDRLTSASAPRLEVQPSM